MEQKPKGPDENPPAEPERGPEDVEPDVETIVGGHAVVQYIAPTHDPE